MQDRAEAEDIPTIANETEKNADTEGETRPIGIATEVEIESRHTVEENAVATEKTGRKVVKI